MFDLLYLLDIPAVIGLGWLLDKLQDWEHKQIHRSEAEEIYLKKFLTY